MTKDEFIDIYMERSRLNPVYRTQDGFKIGDHPGNVALPCFCGDPICDGWAMVSNYPDSIETHKQFYGTPQEKLDEN
jgi:hypothetical protein